MSTELLQELLEAGFQIGQDSRRPRRRIEEAPRNANTLSRKEAKLWAIINRALLPEELAAYRELRSKAEQEILTKSEHRELLRLSDRVEVLHAERLKAVIDLAVLRGISAAELAESAGIEVSINA